MPNQPTRSKPIVFADFGHALLVFWTAKNGRWYWARKVNGEVTDSGNYAHRRSVRRKLRQLTDSHILPPL